MRYVQNGVLLIGAAALGVGVGAMVVNLGLSMLFKPPQGESFGGAIAWVALIVCGAIAGGLIGFIGAVRWITQKEIAIWRPVVWLGIAVGFGVGMLITSLTSGRYYWWFWLMRAAFYAPSCAAAGGFLTHFRRREQKPRKRSR
jgi:hypothetical protein